MSSAVKLTPLSDITIAASGTPVRVSSTIPGTTGIIFQAPTTNTGSIYIGDSTVSATKGIELTAGASLNISGMFLRHGSEVYVSDFWIDTSTGGNKVKVSYLANR